MNMSKPSTAVIQQRGDKSEPEASGNLIEMKCGLLKKHYQADHEQENLKQLNEKIIYLREDLAKHKKEIFDSIASLQEISAVNKRYEIEKEIENVLDISNLFSSSGTDLNQYLKDLTLAVEHEKSKLSFQKTLLESQDGIAELLSETELELKSELHNEESGINAVKKFTTFLPALEESLGKCNDYNAKCAEIIERLQRLTLHRNTLQTINNDNAEV